MTREKAINVLEDALSRAVFMDDIDVLEMAIAALREQEDPKMVLVEHYIKVPEMPKWISVEERLPEEDGFYLVWGPTIYTGTKWYDKSNFSRYFWKHDVTHWMPLPEAPKEDV